MKKRIHIDQHAIRRNRKGGPCEACKGSGEKPVVINPDWPSGDQPYCENSGEPCEACGGTGEHQEPVISVKTYKGNTKAHSVEIDGPSRVVYSPDKPLSCGARVWIETDSPIRLDNRLADDVS